MRPRNLQHRFPRSLFHQFCDPRRMRRCLVVRKLIELCERPRHGVHPVAKTVTCMSSMKQQSARFRVPITLLRMVASLLSSHQSTLGRPVQPAQFRTCVGLTRLSSASTSPRPSMRTVVASTILPLRCRSSYRCPAIQPFPPQIKNDCGLSDVMAAPRSNILPIVETKADSAEKEKASICRREGEMCHHSALYRNVQGQVRGICRTPSEGGSKESMVSKTHRLWCRGTEHELTLSANRFDSLSERESRCRTNSNRDEFRA